MKLTSWQTTMTTELRGGCDAVSARPCAFLLWGAQAQGLRGFIRPGAHLVIESPHPSPLSARRGFFGSRPFSRVNGWLAARGEVPIDWVAVPVAGVR